ncbi:MAG: hypothetical protein Tp125SUR00d2C35697761_14 [Prokaryotic dsDNA virus sp.]|nr:MAG: hypothetical protein Tp125SUR00d2C35697761_14 [Prokaryotic dsDNA virus sp.]|tara:strand:- start:11171 stop:11533 length:363 start_codon:yes stop_codon:yes gene_type:complete
MSVAPDKGHELNHVMLGLKPIASLSKKKHPVQYERALTLRHVQGVVIVRQTDEVITVSKAENIHLHGVYTILTKTPKKLVRSKEGKQVLMGRMFGYTDDQIADFIKADIKCDCAECRWDG